MTILLVVVILVVLIVAHEFGHFIAAKLFRIRVEEFGIGYPPRAVLYAKFDGTEYTLNWIPFGGFVRLFGEEGERGQGSFADSARWKQAIVLVAGVAMNAVAAYLLFAAALHTGIPRVVQDLPPGTHGVLVVSDVVHGSPADILGLQLGDTITSISDQNGATPTSLTPQAVVDFVSTHAGKRLAITYERANATTTVQLTPAQAVLANDAARPAIGIGLAIVATESVSWSEALSEAVQLTKETFVAVGAGLWAILSGVLHGAPDLSDVVGPVGLVQVVGEASRTGFGDVLSLAAFISINLVFINLVPIPVLDGGKLFFLAIEAVLRRKLPKLFLQLVNSFGLALIIILMVTVTYHDIARLLI